MDPATRGALRTAPITAVHYEETLRGTNYDDRRGPPVIWVSAPTERIKRRVLDLIARESLGPLRVVAEPRIAYPGGTTIGPSRTWAPDVDRLRRTFRTGLVLEIYSPSAWADRGHVRLRVLGRLVRLDDAAVLWVRECDFVGRLSPQAYAMKDPAIEDLLGAELVREADRCAADLAAHFRASG